MPDSLVYRYANGGVGARVKYQIKEKSGSGNAAAVSEIQSYLEQGSIASVVSGAHSSPGNHSRMGGLGGTVGGI